MKCEKVILNNYEEYYTCNANLDKSSEYYLKNFANIFRILWYLQLCVNSFETIWSFSNENPKRSYSTYQILPTAKCKCRTMGVKEHHH